MGAHALGGPVADGAQVQVDGFEAAEVGLDDLESLVGVDHSGGVEAVGGDGGAHDVDAVEGGLGVDVALFAGVGEAGVVDGEREVLGHLVAVALHKRALATSTCRVRPGSEGR